MRFKVTKEYARGGESQFAQFTQVEEARSFIKEKLTDDAALKVRVIYRIYEFTDLLEEFDPDKLGTSSGATQSSAGSQGKSSEASFRPTPLSTAPRPAGMPQNWRVDKDKDDEKDK